MDEKSMRNRFTVRPADESDVDEIVRMETISFPPDEAASPPTIKMRQKIAGAYFVVVVNETAPRSPLGFINGTCILTEEIHHDSMTNHEPSGNTLVIHSVTIDPSMRKQKLGSFMLKEYISMIARECHEIKRLLLLSKAYLLSFYASCGFQIVGLSNVEHGQV
jgi:GNAT superfamily N-acetyltransferase